MDHKSLCHGHDGLYHFDAVRQNRRRTLLTFLGTIMAKLLSQDDAVNTMKFFEDFRNTIVPKPLFEMSLSLTVSLKPREA